MTPYPKPNPKPHIQKPELVAGKSLRFTSELYAIFQAKPAEIMDGIVQKLRLRSPLVYAALSEELLLSCRRGGQEWDDIQSSGGGGWGGGWGGRGGDGALNPNP